MTNVLIIYTTTMGNTEKMTQAVADGVRSVAGTEVKVLEAAEALKDKAATERTQSEAQRCDALILGSPMRHRSADYRIKRFIEDVMEFLWMKDEMLDKVGGVYTVGGGYGNMGAGCEVAQLGMLAAMAANGMILVPFPKSAPGAEVAGCHWGAAARSGGPHMEPFGITEEMMTAGFYHGATIARVAAALKGKELMARGNVAPPPEVLEKFMGGGQKQPTG